MGPAYHSYHILIDFPNEHIFRNDNYLVICNFGKFEGIMENKEMSLFFGTVSLDFWYFLRYLLSLLSIKISIKIRRGNLGYLENAR